MAEAILLTGKRGEGKSKSAVRMIRDYLRQGRVVATNLDIRLDGLMGPLSEVRAFRLPDVPKATDLEMLPIGNPDPTNESRNGLLVLDEAAVFLNSRDWNDKDRKGFISWLAQSRKFGWDLVMIAQHPRMVDAQIRDSIFELSGIAKRTDKMAVPLLSPIWSLIMGRPLRFPPMHVVTFRYGFAHGAPKAMSWFFSGGELHAGYDTLQKISAVTGQQGLSQFLSAWELKGRHMTKTQLYRGVAISASMLGMMIGAALAHYVPPMLQKPESVSVEVLKPEPEQVIGTAVAGPVTRLMLSDGRTIDADGADMTPDGILWRASGRVYRGAK